MIVFIEMVIYIIVIDLVDEVVVKLKMEIISKFIVFDEINCFVLKFEMEKLFFVNDIDKVLKERFNRFEIEFFLLKEK